MMSDATGIFSQLDWNNDDDVLGFMERAVKDRETHNADVERQAEYNIAWYRGHQLLFWNKNTQQLQLQPNRRGRVRLVANLMRGLLDGFAAKLALDKIRLRTEPATDDIDDHDTAEIQTQLPRYYGNYLNMPGLEDEVDQWAMLTGEAFVKVTWDAQKGSEFDEFAADDFEMEPEEFDKEFGDEIRDAGLRTGDLSVSNIPIFNVWWGPPGVKFEDAEFILEVYERSVASVMERYGLKRDDIVTGYDNNVKVWRPGSSNVFGSVSREQTDDVVIVKELQVKPNRVVNGLKNGRHCIAICEKMVKNGPNPYRHRGMTIVRFPFLKVSGESRGDTFASDMIPLQANINKTISQFCENRELMANPKWLARLGSILNLEEWDNKPGGVGIYSGEKPSLEQGAAMPNAVLMMLQQDIAFLKDIVGLRDVSQGKNPPGVRSGRGIALLKEADDERMGKIAQRRRTFWSEVGRLMLQTLEQFVTEERVVRIAGEDSVSETLTYAGDMLSGKNGQSRLGVEYFNVKVESQGLPRSYSARLEAMDRALERGALNPAEDPHDKALVLEILEMGKGRQPLDHKKKARAIQHRRNREMAKGNYTDPDIHEDLETMLQELAAFRHEPFFPEMDHELFDKYEDTCIGLMALKSIRVEQITQKALQQAGVMPQSPAPENSSESG
jgi:hypothetical protein